MLSRSGQFEQTGTGETNFEKRDERNLVDGNHGGELAVSLVVTSKNNGGSLIPML